MSESLPTILSYCSTFLPEEAVHIHRQVSGILRYQNRVVTRRRLNAERFPHPHVDLLRRGTWRFVARAFGRMRNHPAPLVRAELRQLAEIATVHHARLVHAYLGSEALRILPFLARFAGARVVSFHGADLSDRYDREIYAPLWKEADLVLCRCHALNQVLVERGCPPDRIRLNYTGVPVPDATTPAQFPRPSREAPLQLLQVCRFIEKKGIDVSLRTVRELRLRNVPATLTLAGGGPDRERLAALATDLGIAGQVVFAGFLDEPELVRLRRRSHIFLHPSRTTAGGNREGIPNSLLEAMAWGLPVVATRHSGIPEAVTDHQSGMLISEASADAAAAAILELVGNPGLYETISRNAAEVVRTRFSLDASRRNLEEHYAEALLRRAGIRS